MCVYIHTVTVLSSELFHMVAFPKQNITYLCLPFAQPPPFSSFLVFSPSSPESSSALPGCVERGEREIERERGCRWYLETYLLLFAFSLLQLPLQLLHSSLLGLLRASFLPWFSQRRHCYCVPVPVYKIIAMTKGALMDYMYM